MSPSSPPPTLANDASVITATERTPLLESATQPQITDNGATTIIPEGCEEEDVPLPRGQIYLLCAARCLEPIIFFSIFPYINAMIEDTGGIDVDDVGFYAGLIESCFSALQAVVLLVWGKVASRYGRKPVLTGSLIGMSIATCLFGMSKTLWQMVLFRCAAGMFCGSVATVRTMITEQSTKKTQSTSLGYFAFAGNIGILIGPLIGGALENPAKNIPLFSNSAFFKRYPYSLPCFAVAFLGVMSAILCIVFIEETLYLKDSKTKTNQKPATAWELLKRPDIQRVLTVCNYISVLAFAFTAVSPVFLFTPNSLGGMSFSPKQIAACIAVNGVSQAAWLLFMFPSLHRRLDTLGIFRLCAFGWPLFLAAHPLCALLWQKDFKAATWTIGTLTYLVGSGVAMCYAATAIAVSSVSETSEELGTLTSIQLSMASGIRAFVPAIAGSIYALGVKYQILNGQFFWVIMVVLGVLLTPVLRIYPTTTTN